MWAVRWVPQRDMCPTPARASARVGPACDDPRVTSKEASGPVPEARRRAVHEAGHAVASVLLRGTPRGSVSAAPDEAAKAHREYPPSLVTPGRWEARPPRFEADLLARLAGAAAERAILGTADPLTEAADEQVVLDALLARGRRGEVALAAMAELRGVAASFVAEVPSVIEAAAEELQTRERIAGPEFAVWVKERIGPA